MLISHLFLNQKTPAPRFAPGLFVGLIAAFALLGQSKPVFGLAGLGVTSIITGTLVILNRQRIWDNYRARFKKDRGLKGVWVKPNPVYYTINVLFLWPFIIFLGIICLWAAYILA